MTDEELSNFYRERHQQILKPIAAALQDYLGEILGEQPRVDRVSVRAKSLESYLAKATKAENGQRKYSDPVTEIQDQLGARVIVFYLDDLPPIRKKISDYFGRIEDRRVEPESAAEFGYEGHHYILFLPEEAFPRGVDRAASPKVFELQIKTLCQHAWSEASHDLIYKPEAELTHDQKRRAAFAAAQTWGADLVFHGLVKELRPDIASNVGLDASPAST